GAGDGRGVERSRGCVRCYADTRCSTQGAGAVPPPRNRAYIPASKYELVFWRDSCSVELPASATWRTHPRDLSTPPQALRFFVVGRDDTSLYAETARGPAVSCPNFTETTLDTPGSCIVTPYITGATAIVFLLCV